MLPATKFTANIFLILVTDLIIKIANYGLVIFLARNLSISSFGFYNFILAYFYFFWVVSDFGLQYLATRQFAERQSDFNKIVATRFYMAIIAFALCGSILFLLDMPSSSKLLIVLYSCAIFFIAVSEAIFPVFRGTENFIYERIVSLIKSAIFVAGAFIAVYINTTLYMLALVYLLSEIVGALMTVFFLKKYFSGHSDKLIKALFNVKNFSLGLLKQSFPLALGIALLISYYKIDGIMLKLLAGDYALGIYSSAYRIFEATLFIPIAIHMALIPRLLKVDKDNLASAVEKVIKITFSIGLIVSLVVIYFSGYLPALYGKQGYQALVQPLVIVFLVLPVAFINYIFVSIAYVLKQERRIVLPLLITIIVNIGLNYFLIPKYSYIAAAWSTGISEILLLGLITFIVVPEFANKLMIVKLCLIYLVGLVPYFLFHVPLMVFPVIILVILALYGLKIYEKSDIDIFGTIYYELTGLKKA